MGVNRTWAKANGVTTRSTRQIKRLRKAANRRQKAIAK